jgi:hypothetical protein
MEVRVATVLLTADDRGRTHLQAESGLARAGSAFGSRCQKGV